MKFNGNKAYFLTPTNKYGLSKVEPKDITEDNFTYIARLTIDWDKMNKDMNERLLNGITLLDQYEAGSD